MLGTILIELSAKLSSEHFGEHSSEHSGEPMQSGTVSVDDSGNQQEETDDETETTEAEFFMRKLIPKLRRSLRHSTQVLLMMRNSAPLPLLEIRLLLPTILPNQTLTTKPKTMLEYTKQD